MNAGSTTDRELVNTRVIDARGSDAKIAATIGGYPEIGELRIWAPAEFVGAILES